MDETPIIDWNDVLMTRPWRGRPGQWQQQQKKNKKLYKRSARLVTNLLKVNSRRCETLPASLIKIKKDEGEANVWRERLHFF